MEPVAAGGGSSWARRWPQIRPWLRAASLLLLLVPVAYALALARQWLFFPWNEIEEALRAGPFRGYGRTPLLRELGGLTVELLALAGLVAWALHTRGRTSTCAETRSIENHAASGRGRAAQDRLVDGLDAGVMTVTTALPRRAAGAILAA